MFNEGFDKRVKTSQIVQNQIPEFILSENSAFVDFLKQYYISQEYQGGPTDILDNLDQYLKLDNLTEENLTKTYTLTQDVDVLDDEIHVSSTIGFPNQYGLIKIGNEIITYTGTTANSFTGCIRGFSGVESYEPGNYTTELVFRSSEIEDHTQGSEVENLSVLFLKQFYYKIKSYLTPELENLEFVSDLNVGNFLKEVTTLYKTKGTEESFRILFNVLYGVTPSILNLEKHLIKPSASEYIRRKVLFGELVDGDDPAAIIGQTLISSDGTANGPISGVEIVTKNNITTYKISLFEGYDDRSLINGTFNITPATKVIGNTSAGSKTLTVDSTIGFPQSGSFICGNNIVSYTEKTVNQFLNCNNILEDISDQDVAKMDRYVYSYENGDVNKMVRFSVSNILSELNFPEDTDLTNDNEGVNVINLGDNVQNPELNKSYKELLFNSWIYNTSSRYQISLSESNTSHLTRDVIDKSSLRVGDVVELVDRVENIIYGYGRVSVANNHELKLESYVNTSGEYVKDKTIDVKRRLKYASSRTAELKYPNLLANIQNVYSEGDDYAYVATNSLPAFEIDSDFASRFIDIADLDSILNNSVIFPQSVLPLPFITGDEIVYTCENFPIIGLENERSYFVKVIDSDRIRLFVSKSFIYTDNYVEISTTSSPLPGKHFFTLKTQYNKKISTSKSLRKISLKPKINSGLNEETVAGKPVAMLTNGTEIISYKGTDKIFYGPIDSKTIYNSGKNYDVTNPPLLVVSSPNVSAGNTAKITPVLSGYIEDILLETPEVEVNNISYVRITGGNGSGCTLNPIVEIRQSEFEFNAKTDIDVFYETISFTKEHYLNDGQAVVYNANGNLPIGQGDYQGSNSDQGKTLLNGGLYYVKVYNSKSIQLFGSQNDYNAGINTVGFTTISNTGIHKFRTVDYKKVLVDISVTDGGSGYTNRNLIVKPENISIQDSSITFTNHGFSDGDLVTYASENPISGLSTSNQYYIIKLNNNQFKLANAGIGGTIKSEYDRKDYVRLTSVGSGYHNFNYPEITVDIGVSYATTSRTIKASPVVRGSIIDTYIYEKGSDYGSTILNYHNKPNVYVRKGKDATVRPVVINGKIVQVVVETTGSEYYSVPELIITGSGSGAKLNPIIKNGKLDSIIVVKSGLGYDSNTKISVRSPGNEFNIDLNVRELVVNNHTRFGSEYLNSYGALESDEALYSVLGYSDKIRSAFSDNIGTENEPDHSPIIGWAYDGNPIYGAFGYSVPGSSETVKRLETSYVINTSLVENRPSELDFAPGFFIEDYVYDGSGDLDLYNGRYAKTPDFPNGVYAYYATISPSPSEVGSYIPQFPYYIGKYYKSKIESGVFNLNQQNFNFETSGVQRNTFPYRIGQLYSSSDYVDFVYNKGVISSVIEESSRGGIVDFNIIDPGVDYKVNDTLIVDNTGSSGFGVSAKVFSVKGKEIDSILTSVDSYEGLKVIKKDSNTVNLYLNPYHNFEDQSYITISEPSSPVAGLNGIHRIGVTTFSSFILKEIPENTNVGIITDIYVAEIPNTVSTGSSIVIGGETMSVLNKFDLNRVIRVRRNVGSSHSESTVVNYLPDYFTINLKVKDIDSSLNDKVYFNPVESVGIGSQSGIGTDVNVVIGEITKQVSVQSQTIYLPNHPFTNNQQVRLHKPSAISASFAVSDGTNSFYVPPQVEEYQDVYIVNSGNNSVGILTTLNSDPLYFLINADDDYEYYFESLKETITTDASVSSTIVQTTENHNLDSGDIISLSLVSDRNVGIAVTSTYVKLKYNDVFNKILLSPVGFGSESVDTNNNLISIVDHGYKTGDKVFYEHTNESISGLSTGEYFVLNLDSDTFKLSETYLDSISDPPSTVSFASTGGSLQTLSLINPPIKLIKNDTLVFDVSDSSLVDSNLNFYYDNTFINEFVSTGSTSQFNVVRTGVSGISSNATVKLEMFDGIDHDLYYSLRKDINTILPDLEVRNYSSIKTKSSDYNGRYKVIGAGSTTFSIILREKPERISYASTEISNLSYTTTSTKAIGGISEIRSVFSGIGYAKLPKYIGVASSEGRNAKIQLSTNNIGKINDIKIKNEGIVYPSDITLSPKGRSSLICNIIDNQEVTDVSVIYGGQNYYVPPRFVCVNSQTRESIEGVAFEATLSSGSISKVDIVSSPRGLSSVEHEIYTLDNTNGINIRSVLVPDQSGKVLCTLSTPIVGFSTFAPPFEVGDEVFVEGIEKIDGSGFNSEDHGFTFFKVTNYYPLNPAIVEFDIGSAPGTARTLQSFAQIINKKLYPQFSTYQENSTFLKDEIIYINYGGGYVPSDYIVYDYINNYIKLKGKGVIRNGNLIKGEKSGAIARIENYVFNDGNYLTAATYEEKSGWNDEIGHLNFDQQVLEDNDYYQSLSYSIRSPITYDEISDSVNRIVHPTGLKNFADVQISNNISVDVVNQSQTTLIVDFIDELRADERHSYDLVLDSTDSSQKTRDIRFLNKKLTDYFKCKTNRVLTIDDISDRFSSKIFGQEPYVDILIYPNYTNYSRFLVQSFGNGNSDYQLDDIIVINDNINAYTINRGNVGNTFEPVVDLYGNMEEGVLSLRFEPSDPEDSSYNIKTFRGYYDTSLSGIGSTSIGNIKLNTKTEQVLSGITTNFVEISSTKTNGLMCEVFVRDNVTTEMNFFELAIDHDGSDSYIAEYYIDTLALTSGISGTPIGSFGTTLENGVLRVSFTNNSQNRVTLKSKIHNFNPTTTPGITTYRFKSPGQPDGSERTARLESRHNVVAIATDAVSPSANIISIDKSTDASFKSIIKVNHLNGTSIHQVLFGYDGSDTYVLPKYYISVGSTSGIGTFGSSTDSTNAILKFYPDEGVTGRFDITSYTEVLYKDLDLINTETSFEYGTSYETVLNTKFNSLNGNGNDQLDFVLEHNDVPIFEKTFNPTEPELLTLESGIINIEDHFFADGEELEYTAQSSYVGVTAESIGIGETIAGGTSFVGTVISGISTISGITLSFEDDVNLIYENQLAISEFIPEGTTIVSVGQTYQYFVGNVIGSASTVITGIANTSIFEVGSEIFGQDGSSIGSIEIIGDSEITLDTLVSVGSSVIYYTDNLGFGISMSNPGSATTFSSSILSGILTDKMPSTVYAIRVNKDSFKLSGTKNSGIGFTFTDYGVGNSHKIGMKKKLEKAIITVDNIIQYPILYTDIVHNLDSSITDSDEFVTLTGISSINPRDLLKVDSEYLKVINVGYGVSSLGPITGIGTFKLVEFERAYVGSSATSHVSGTEARVYRGSYNIVGDKIFFTEAPKGIGDNARRNSSNLPLTKSSFNGRVFLRNDYTTNLIYDDFSSRFTGIGQTYAVTYRGEDVNYVEPGSGILFINETFQTPTTENNEGNNYSLVSVGSTTDVVFSGIKSPETNEIITSDYDVNQNQLPRGGIIVSLASTSGLGYAPAIGARVIADIDSNGTIVDIIDYPVKGESLTVLDAVYDGYSGIVTVTTSESHYFNGIGEYVYLEGLEFTCTSGAATTTIYPTGNNGFIFPITGVGATNVFSANVGVSTIDHTYVGLGTAYQYFNDLTPGSGYYGTVSIGVSDTNHSGSDATITAVVGAGGTLSFTIVDGGSGYTSDVNIITPSPSYQNLEVVGISRLGIGETTDCGDGLLLTLDVTPSTRRMSGRYSDAANLIRRNKALIAEVAVGRMLDYYTSFNIPGGNQECIDDILGVLDSIIHNLEFSGNDKVYDSAKIYVDNAYLSGEEEQSIYAYEQARDLAIQAMRNEEITIGGYSNEVQYFDYTVIGDASEEPGVYNPGDCADVASAIGSFVGIVTTAIDSGTLPTRTSSYLDLYEVSEFKISRTGYNFQRGDKITAVGLVTAAHLAEPTEKFELTVLGTFTDSAALWQFGELDYIDSIKKFQTAERRRFPLYRNNELISFEVDPTDPDSILIDLESLLLVFINGILQEPGRAYQFYGGTSIIFEEPIKPEDDVDIFFYRGTRGEDSFIQSVTPELKSGDFVRILPNRSITNTRPQEQRVVFDIIESDLIETNVYSGIGIDTSNPRPLSIIPQKRDRIINSNVVSKGREILTSQIFPTSRIIRSLSQSDTEIFVDDSQSFVYESGDPLNRTISSVGAIVVNEIETESAAVSATIKNGGLSSVQITDSGSGYESAPTVSINEGTGATLTANLSSLGFIKRFEITNGGSGYTYPPFVTFGGGLASQSGTSVIEGGSVTNIILDGITYDTTDSDDVYEFGNGTSIAPNGTGTGSTGGFNIGSSHLRFGDASGTRYVVLNPIDARSINTVRVYAIRGNGTNGGETPDVVGVEDLRLQYQITDQGEAPDSNLWTDLGVVIPAVPNGTGTGILDNYDFTLDQELQVGHIYFRLYQEGNSGPNNDHYGILSVTFLGDASAEIPDSTVTLTANPLEPSPITDNATAEVILGKRIESISITNNGQDYTLSSIITITGGDYTTQASATVSEIGGYVDQLTIVNAGSGYVPSSTLELSISTPGGTLSGIAVTATANANISSSGSLDSISIINPGIGYNTTPYVSVPSPDIAIENISDITFVTGFSGIVTGITTTSGIGTSLALQFHLNVESGNFNTLLQDYPIYIYDTQVGNGVTSINDSDNSVVGIGTTFLDNIYYVHNIVRDGENAVITSNIKSDSNIVEIPASGTNIGKFSWGRLSLESRESNGIAFNLNDYVVSGLSSYPQIQRRNYGLRDTGSFAN